MRESVCLNCTLPACDESDKRCRYVQILQRGTVSSRHRKQELAMLKDGLPEILKSLDRYLKRRDIESRRQREWYERNREKKLAKSKEYYRRRVSDG